MATIPGQELTTWGGGGSITQDVQDVGFTRGAAITIGVINTLISLAVGMINFAKSFHAEYARLRTLSWVALPDGDYGSAQTVYVTGTRWHYRTVNLPHVAASGTGDRVRLVEARAHWDALFAPTLNVLRYDASPSTSWATVGSATQGPGSGIFTVTLSLLSYEIANNNGITLETGVNVPDSGDRFYGFELDFYHIGAF